MSDPILTTTTAGADASVEVWATWHRPPGMARRYDRLRRGLARRLRLPFVRETLWERDNPQAHRYAVSYGPMWTSTNALANYSFACTCHKRERYSRKRKHRSEP